MRPRSVRPLLTILAASVLPPLLPGQASGPAGSIPPDAPSYRGFVAGATYREFARRARAMQRSRGEPLVCTTSRRTAQLMECRVAIRDTTDGIEFTVTAHFVDGRAGFLSFGDSGGAALPHRLQAELRAARGLPTRVTAGMWEWGSNRRFTRLNWRGRGDARWIYLTLTDLDVLDLVRRYVTPPPAPDGHSPSRAGARPGG